MSICSVCYENCRSKCGKCGKSLCVKCKPKGRGKCPVCPASSRSSKAVGNAYYTPTNSQAQAAFSAAQPAATAAPSRISSSRPPVRPPLAPIQEYETMLPQDVVRHTEDLIRRLELKQERELAYLQRRYDRGTFTPTDQAYGQDQVLEGHQTPV